MAKNFRLYIQEELEQGKTVTLSESQTHYLKNVVKYTPNDILCCFDNKNGEFICKISNFGKKTTEIEVLNKKKDFTPCPDIWILFAPIKKDKTDFIIEKSTELGCRKIIPVITKHTITQNIKLERYIAQSIEASEQCRRTDIPEILPPIELQKLLNNWDETRTLFFMDETQTSKDFKTILAQNPTSKAAILVGPEGGFSETELNTLRNKKFAIGATLGPRILRAETAVASALTCWQLICGDWSNQ